MKYFHPKWAPITIFERMSDFKTSSFIQMDPPKHDIQRKTVTGVVAPTNLALLQPVIRERAAKILGRIANRGNI